MAPAGSAVEADRRLALIVEDDRDAAAVACGMLAALGWSCELAVDGRQALLLAAELEPDVVLLDVCLPGIDGIGVMKVLRRLQEVRPTRVIAASAIYSRDSAQARQLEALGIDGFLHKPFKTEELAEALLACGLSTGEPLPPRVEGHVAITIGGQPLIATEMTLQGSVLEILLRSGGAGAGSRVTVETPDGSAVLGTVFSAVPEGRALRCRVALEGVTPEQSAAMESALAK